MVKAGLCSVSFRKLSVAEIVDLGRRAGLDGIEWGGDVHVRHGDVGTARETWTRCRDAGLDCPSYGSYYRVGSSESKGPRFAEVLAAAIALESRTIRVWAGTTNLEGAADDDVARVVEDTFRIARMAEVEGMTISFEYHGGTYTNTDANAQAFARRVAHPAVRFYWQPPHGQDAGACFSGLQALRDRVTNVHVFHWRLQKDNDGKAKIENLLLEEGTDRWQRFLDLLEVLPGEHWAHLEFTRHEDPANTVRDAAALRGMLKKGAPP
jgi:sugar phosphate isomerase/epimerase